MQDKNAEYKEYIDKLVPQLKILRGKQHMSARAERKLIKQFPFKGHADSYRVAQASTTQRKELYAQIGEVMRRFLFYFTQHEPFFNLNYIDTPRMAGSGRDKTFYKIPHNNCGFSGMNGLYVVASAFLPGFVQHYEMASDRDGELFNVFECLETPAREAALLPKVSDDFFAKARLFLFLNFLTAAYIVALSPPEWTVKRHVMYRKVPYRVTYHFTPLAYILGFTTLSITFEQGDLIPVLIDIDSLRDNDEVVVRKVAEDGYQKTFLGVQSSSSMNQFDVMEATALCEAMYKVNKVLPFFRRDLEVPVHQEWMSFDYTISQLAIARLMLLSNRDPTIQVHQLDQVLSAADTTKMILTSITTILDGIVISMARYRSKHGNDTRKPLQHRGLSKDMKWKPGDESESTNDSEFSVNSSDHAQEEEEEEKENGGSE